MIIITLFLLFTNLPLCFILTKANLEMKKARLTADLVCLLEETSKPRDTADLKAEIESYFVLGAARIDMIGKVIDLDNNIGTHNFDIPLLYKTEIAITKLSLPPGEKASQDFFCLKHWTPYFLIYIF